MNFKRDPLILILQGAIRIAVRIMAVLITLVIFWGVLDIVWIIYRKLTSEPRFLLDINDLLQIFGGFMAVLIAIEIFINVIAYLRSKAIHVKIVLATALVAIARKVIVFDFDNLEPVYVWATAAVIIALSAAYWMIGIKGGEQLEKELENY
jgi:uncharacterized membrane protein (DUF373 family)